MTGVQIRIRLWPPDCMHGRWALADAAARGRAAGPGGTSIAWLDTETTGLAGARAPTSFWWAWPG